MFLIKNLLLYFFLILFCCYSNYCL